MSKTKQIASESLSAGGSSVKGAKQRGKKMTKFAVDLDSISSATRVGQRPTAGNVAPQFAFPTVYKKGQSKQEQIAELKHQAVQQTNPITGATPYGVVTASDKDFEWILEREDIKRAIDYDRLFLDLFDTNDPAHVKLMHELRPEFFTERMNFIKQLASIQVHLAEIALTGIQTKDDLDLVLGLQMAHIPDNMKDAVTGLPKILSVPVHKLSKEAVLGIDVNGPGSEEAYRAATGTSTMTDLVGGVFRGAGKSFGLQGFNWGERLFGTDAKRFHERTFPQVNLAGVGQPQQMGYAYRQWPPGNITSGNMLVRGLF